MTATSSLPPPLTETRTGPTAARTAIPGAVRWMVVAGAALVTLSIVRVVANGGDLTSSGTTGATIRLAAPILLAGLGGLVAERAGVINIGLEGMMILGAWTSAFFGYEYGVWVGLLAGFVAGALGGLVHAIATVSFGVDHIVSGVAINFIAPGLVRFLAGEYFPQRGGSISNSPQVTGNLGSFSVPFLSGGYGTPDALGRIESWDWFFVSDAAGILKGATSGLSTFTLLAFGLVPALWFFLWHTRLGLRLRSVGEHPWSADSLGVPVYRMKYLGVLLSGGLAGLGGAYLVLAAGANIYREGMTANRGFIALAAVVVGNWRPLGVMFASLLFGFGFALQLRDKDSVHALLLFAAIAGLMLLILLVQRRHVTSAGIVAAGVGGAFVWWVVSDSVPDDFIFITPYVLTLVVATVASGRLRPPAADGVRWRKGQAV
jgi:simple sugar transport system permease protein